MCPNPMGYTQGGDRWSGIEGGYGKNGVPSCPPWGDCSSYATWIYWTVFGPPCLCSGADFINNDDWKAGYTGTMLETGEEIDCRSLLPADLIIYGTAYPGLHVAIYVGLNSDGQGVTIGHGGPGLQSVIWDEMGMPVLGCRSYLPDDVKSSNAVRTE